MKKYIDKMCSKKNIIIIISLILLILSFIGIKNTRINYDILVYLPQDIDTIKGQNILTDDLKMGSYSIAVIDNMSGKDILKLEDKIKNIDGVNKVVSLYDVLGTSIPIEVLPNDVVSKVHKDNTDILFITFYNSTSSEETIGAVRDIRKITDGLVKQGGMSSMVLDTMDLSEKEIFTYIVIAVILCLIVLQFTSDSYIVPFLLLINIGCAIVFNLGSNVFLGEISYITKALVAVLQLGVTTDFSIFLYNAYENKKKTLSKEKAMSGAIMETFSAVTGSSLTTIAGFLVLCTMQLTLGKDLGIVMAKGVLLGVVTVLTLFPSLLLSFDKIIEKTKHKKINFNFTRINKFVVKHSISIFIIFLLLIYPMYKANSKVDVYYKLDRSLPSTLESIKTNKILKEKYNIVSPEIILVSNNIKNDQVNEMTKDISSLDGIDMVLSFSNLEKLGITDQMIDNDLLEMIKTDKYQVIFINSLYDIATDELNLQVDKIDKIIKKYDSKAIIAGEGPLMKDLIKISDIDFRNVNVSSVICILIILVFVLKSYTLPFLLISAITFAIFTNMGISYFSGTTLPFIASIVLGTIQLGATIDYAILLTTNYLNRRSSGIDKEKAMIDTLNYCGISIITSGMCFFAATFGVGIYSKIEMIGSICSLISRGALISMLTVLIILPAILLICDHLIMKTTKIERKEKMKNNKKAKSITIWLLVCSIVINSLPIGVFALEKKETVYSKLNADGSIKTVIVNENLINNKDLNKLEDYTELKDIINTSNDASFKRDNNNIIWNSNGRDISYSGSISKSLPIGLNISYKLDNKDISVDELIGKKGHVTIILKYSNYDKHSVRVNGRIEELYTPFVCTMGTIIDTDNNSNIIVSNGKVSYNGNKNVIAGISAPGLYESLKLDEFKGMDTITINYDTTNFSLSSIYTIITPKLIESSDLDVFKKMDSLYSSVDKLQQNMNTIEDGAVKVRNGSNKLKDGLNTSISMIKNDKSPALTQEQINIIKEQTINRTKGMFTEEYKDIIANNTWNAVQKELSNANDETIKNLAGESVINTLTEYLGGKENLMIYMGCLKQDENSLGMCTLLKDKGYDYKNVYNLQNILTKNLGEFANKSTIYTSEVISKSVAKQVSYNTASEVASNIASSLVPSVADMVKNGAMDKTINSLNTLYGGINQLDSGINDLSTGISKYNEEGIKKLNYMTNNYVRGTTNRVKALINLGTNYKSFASKRNDTLGETKFIMVVDSIRDNSKEKIVNKANKKTSFWDRVVNLFD